MLCAAVGIIREVRRGSSLSAVSLRASVAVLRAARPFRDAAVQAARLPAGGVREQ